MGARRIIGAAAFLAGMVAATAWAGSENRIGTGGALELQLPVGARNVAMAGSNLGAVSGIEALFYNPAGIASGSANTEVMFSHTDHLADIDLNFVGVTQRIGDLGIIGLSAKVLSIGDIPFTSESSPDGNGEVFSPTFATLGLTYARKMTDRVNFGGTVHYVSEKILQETAGGVAFDFGFQYDTGYRGMMLGMAMKNFGPNMEFSGSDFERNIFLPEDDPQAAPHTVSTGSAKFELPSYFQLGLSYPLLQGTNSLRLHGLYQNNSFATDQGRLGAEWMYRSDAALRLGYAFSEDEDDLFGLSYGAGVRVPLGGANLWVDYAGQSVSDFFDDLQHIALSLVF